MNEQRIPFTALLLGVGGLLPFVALAQAIWGGVPLPLVDDPARAMLAYGAVILSFLGGVRWGFALRMNDTNLQAQALVLSVAPALAAWLALLGPTMLGLVVLPAMFVMLAIADDQLPKIGAPLWYRSLRRLLTLIAVLTMLVAVAGIFR